MKIAAFLLCALAPGMAWADAGCTASAAPVAFGVYTPTAPVADSVTGGVTVTCTGTVQIAVLYTIALSTGSSGSFSMRTMQAGGATLNYQLYTDLGHHFVWGDGSGTTSEDTGGYLINVLAPTVITYTVYGAIPAQQNAMPGSYADTILVTVSY